MKLVVPAETAAQRLDSFLAAELPQHSRSSWQSKIKSGQVRLNGQAAKPKQLVKTEDEIEIEQAERLEPVPVEVPIIYEDDEIVVINKPHGLLTHSVNIDDSEPTVVDALRSRLGEFDDQLRPGIVHRLDRDTSGLLVVAKTQPIMQALKDLFAERLVSKLYRAVLSGDLAVEQAEINLPIMRNPAHPQTYRVDPNGKPAQTSLKRLGRSSGQSFVELKPATGRTHQLRVHTAHIGHPIVGDNLYGQPGPRLMLHAYKLELTLNGAKRKFEAQLPDGFEP